MSPFYYEAKLKFPGLWLDCDEFKKGIVMAGNKADAINKVKSKYESTGGNPVVTVTVFETIE